MSIFEEGLPQSKKENHFFSVVDRYGLKDEEENILIDLVEKYNLEEPEHILVKRNLFDQVAASEMDSILSGDGSMKEKLESIDKLYNLRRKTGEKLMIPKNRMSKEGKVD